MVTLTGRPAGTVSAGAGASAVPYHNVIPSCSLYMLSCTPRMLDEFCQTLDAPALALQLTLRRSRQLPSLRWAVRLTRLSEVEPDHRILELQAVALAAERSPLCDEGCVAEICESTGAVRRDAEWAVGRLDSPKRTHALDDAVGHAREEGFEIPHASTELQAFSRLRRFVLRHRIFRRYGSRGPGRPRGSRAVSSEETTAEETSETP